MNYDSVAVCYYLYNTLQREYEGDLGIINANIIDCIDCDDYIILYHNQ